MIKNTDFFSLPSHASTASIEASNAPFTIIQQSNAPLPTIQSSKTPIATVQTSEVISVASNPPHQSNPFTSTPTSPLPTSSTTTTAPPIPSTSSPTSPLPSISTTTTAPPVPSQISSNDKGSSLCSILNGTTCQIAYSQYNDTYLYQRRASYILPSGVESAANTLFSSADSGCAAVFNCDTDAELAVGMTGAQIKAAFDFLYHTNDHVKICGSSYLSNGCHVTVNACESCEPVVPCGSLSAEDVAIQYPCVT